MTTLAEILSSLPGDTIISDNAREWDLADLMAAAQDDEGDYSAVESGGVTRIYAVKTDGVLESVPDYWTVQA